MKFVSTNGRSSPIDFKQAILSGLASDGGLLIPETIPVFQKDEWTKIISSDFHSGCVQLLLPYVGQEVKIQELERIIDETLTFPFTLVQPTTKLKCLELFHGPTMSFKDVGARFLARCIGYFSQQNSRETSVLVATSGDTGSAVAHGFHNVQNVNVVILFPRKRISDFQRKQMTTIGGNIHCVEVAGSFDHCQRLVKTILARPENMSQDVTSANSINIGRLLPQMFYYLALVRELYPEKPIVSVPSGNYGNLTAGLISKRMGMPISRFIAASNSNNVFSKYLETGVFEQKSSIPTISNAMDVGNPSNFHRIKWLYPTLDMMKTEIDGFSFSDQETKTAMKKVFDESKYILDPHGAVGFLGLEKHLSLYPTSSNVGVFLETADPRKFQGVVKNILPEIDFQSVENNAVVEHFDQINPVESEFRDYLSHLGVK